MYSTIQNGEGFGIATSPSFPSHLLFHICNWQLAATQNKTWNRNPGTGARWRLRRNNFRGKQRERQAVLPSPLEKFQSKQLLEKAACAFCGSTHTAILSVLLHRSLSIVTCCSKCHSPGLVLLPRQEDSHRSTTTATLREQSPAVWGEMVNCFDGSVGLKRALRTGSLETAPIYGLTAWMEGFSVARIYLKHNGVLNGDLICYSQVSANRSRIIIEKGDGAIPVAVRDVWVQKPQGTLQEIRGKLSSLYINSRGGRGRCRTEQIYMGLATNRTQTTRKAK